MFKIRFLTPNDKPSGHSEQLTTDHQLQTQGGVPDRIDRLQTVSRGKVGPNVNTFPMTGGMEYVGQVPLVTIVRGPTMHPGNAIDDMASVPAVFAGNPVQ